MKVVIKKVGCLPELVEIDNTLKALQKAVDGYIEAVTVASDMVIICNEEGVIRGLPYNCTLLGHHFFGKILFVGVDGEEFADVPVPLEDINRMFFGGGCE